VSRVNIIELACTLEGFCNGTCSVLDINFCNDGPLDGLFEYLLEHRIVKSNGYVWPDHSHDHVMLVCVLWLSLNAAFYRQRGKRASKGA